jgi:hypothetical protein
LAPTMAAHPGSDDIWVPLSCRLAANMIVHMMRPYAPPARIVLRNPVMLKILARPIPRRLNTAR